MDIVISRQLGYLVCRWGYIAWGAVCTGCTVGYVGRMLSVESGGSFTQVSVILVSL